MTDLRPFGGRPVPGWQPDAISSVKMCELSELSELSVLLLSFQRGGSVRLKRLMRPKPPFQVKRGWDDCCSGNL
jgi:hypothetical protein